MRMRLFTSINITSILTFNQIELNSRSYSMIGHFLRFCRNIRAQNESSRLWNSNFVTLWNYWKLYEMWRVNPCRPVVQVRLKHSNVEYCLINTNIKNVSTDTLHLSAALIKYLWWKNEIIFRNDWTNKHIATIIIDSSPKQVTKSSNHPISRHWLYKRSRP